MSLLSTETIIDCLKTVIDPASGKDMISLNMLSGVSIEEGKVVLSIEGGPHLEHLRKAAMAAVEKLPGVTSVLAVLTAEKKPPQKNPQRPAAPQVKRFIAVASGKGGVGKSTVAANLALAFAAMGKKTGLLDADIYGASQPRMMGLRLKPELNGNGMMTPPAAHGIKVMSMGFFANENAPVVWRGPMVHGAIQQLLRDVDWGELDVLVIDMPPGTGDAQISIIQNAPLSGAVIVSTPQDVALSEAKKGLALFQKTNVPILGIVENMSYHICSACNHRENIFDHGKVRDAAKKIGVEFLGEIPLNADIRIAADTGTPLVLSQRDHAVSEIFKNIASRVWMNLPEQSKAKEG